VQVLGAHWPVWFQRRSWGAQRPEMRDAAGEAVKEFEEELTQRRQAAKKRTQRILFLPSSLGAFASWRELLFL
jgi:hypothetical protein